LVSGLSPLPIFFLRFQQARESAAAFAVAAGEASERGFAQAA